MTDRDFINRLGTAKDVAATFYDVSRVSLSPSAIYEWKRNGIPARYRQFLIAVAAERGVAVPKGFAPKKRQERAA